VLIDDHMAARWYIVTLPLCGQTGELYCSVIHARWPPAGKCDLDHMTSLGVLVLLVAFLSLTVGN
jgi:hypothetical protein